MPHHRPSAIRLHEHDNVAIALKDIAAGERIEHVPVPVSGPVRRGHKIATRDLTPGEALRRYGQVVGQATAAIRAGEHVHSHNCGMTRHSQDYDFACDNAPLAAIGEERRFMGYRRDDGRVGTRNHIGILTSVNCSGSVARFVAEAAEKEGWLDALENVDGVVPVTHSTGCGMSGRDEGYDALYRTLAGYARHPNFAGILILGLGCEVMQISDLVGGRPIRSDGNLRYMTIQRSGGTRKTVEKSVEVLRDMAHQADAARRTPVPVSELCVGMQCGGSDGYSGITANPALGVASDLLVRHGGTTILSETPEIYGAEHMLTRRAVTREVGEKIVERIRWWEDYTARHGGDMDNNPSPGNKRGGLTTILEKSLGSIAKGGSAPLSEVYRFAEQVATKGFVFMDSPGYDPCSVTGQVAAGATLVAFTTGRGSVSGYKPTPCIKLATNSGMYERMRDDMDINCGDMVEDGVSLDSKGREIFETFIRVASGERTRSEELGFGGVECVPWQIGAVM